MSLLNLVCGLLFIINQWIFCEWYKKGFEDKEEIGIEYPTPSIEKKVSNYESINKFFKKLDFLLGKEDESKELFITKFISKGNIIFHKDLKPILDKHLYNGLVINSGNDSIYISLTKSENCPLSKCDLSDKFFIVFIGDNKHEFVRIKDVINSGSKTVRFYGKDYTVKIKASISDVYLSRLEIENDGKKILSKTLNELRSLFSKSGYDMSIGNSLYKVIYGRKVECESKDICEFKKTNVVFLYEYPPSQDSNFFTIDEEQWKGKTIFFESIGKNYSFYINNGVLLVEKQF